MITGVVVLGIAVRTGLVAVLPGPESTLVVVLIGILRGLLSGQFRGLLCRLLLSLGLLSG